MLTGAMTLEELRMSEGVRQLEGRLSPEVVEIIRLDLIQKVGNALRYHWRAERDLAELNDFVHAEANKSTDLMEWI